MSDSPLVFLHMSDIHFTSGDRFDPDADIRNEIERDVEQLVKLLPPVTGILVTGDIAYRGSQAEYESAWLWLSRFADIAGFLPENVWCVPGNHDVDRAVLVDSPLLRSVQSQLRGARASDTDALLADYARDASAAELLRKPLTSYTQFFATRCGCVPTPPVLYWEDTLVLNDRSILCLRGVNSVVVSNASDDAVGNKLVLGEHQVTAERQNGVCNMLLCHHPPDWLQDHDNLEDIIRARFHIQLFGHKHRQRVTQINNSLRLYAGAVHPSRSEPEWEPRYNAISLMVEGVGKARRLRITVWPRVWNKAKREFVPDDADSDGRVSHDLQLDPWTAPETTPAKRPESSAQPANEVGTSQRTPMRLTKSLLYRFYGLPYHTRVEIALQLGLIQDEDEALPDNERFDRVLQRAKSSDRIAELSEAIEVRERAHK